MEAVAPVHAEPAAGADVAAVAMATLRSVRDRVPYDGAALIVMDPVTHLFSTGAVDDLPESSCHPFFTFELTDDPRTFRRLALDRRPADPLTDAAADHPFVRDVLLPHGYGSEVRTVCRDAQASWAGITLFRRRGARPFTVADRDALDRAGERAGERLRAAVVGSLSAPYADRSQTPAASALGVLLVEDGSLVETSPEATAMLAELGHPAADEYRHVDHLRALAGGPVPFTTVLRTPRGWLTAHGTRLGPRRVAVTVSVAGPERLLGARVVAAGLSAREVEVTRLLCRGMSDREIARELGVSEHTAHDHVRSVRRKLGVRSRAEVSATIFAERYFEQFLASASLSHD